MTRAIINGLGPSKYNTPRQLQYAMLAAICQDHDGCNMPAAVCCDGCNIPIRCHSRVIAAEKPNTQVFVSNFTKLRFRNQFAISLPVLRTLNMLSQATCYHLPAFDQGMPLICLFLASSTADTMASFKLTYRFTWYGEMEERWICDFWEPEIMVLQFLYVERSGSVSFDSVNECELWARWFLEQQRPDARPRLRVLISKT